MLLSLFHAASAYALSTVFGLPPTHALLVTHLASDRLFSTLRVFR